MIITRCGVAPIAAALSGDTDRGGGYWKGEAGGEPITDADPGVGEERADSGGVGVGETRLRRLRDVKSWCGRGGGKDGCTEMETDIKDAANC